jgi:hypothetical protein
MISAMAVYALKRRVEDDTQPVVDVGHRGKAGASPKTDASLLRCNVERVLASDDPRLTRLAAAGTSVSFQTREAPEHSVTVLLDRNPPVLADGQEPAEITIGLTAAQAVRLAQGRLLLPNALLAGEVTYSGPARKYLTVDPVLRSLLAGLDSEE